MWKIRKAGLGWHVAYTEVPCALDVVLFFELPHCRSCAALYVLPPFFRYDRDRRLLRMGRNFAEKVLARRKAAAESPFTTTDEELMLLAPHVHELLTTKLVDGKKHLGVASLALWSADDGWHASVNHRGAQVKWHAIGPTYRGAITALEAAVSKEEATEVNGAGKTRTRNV